MRVTSGLLALLVSAAACGGQERGMRGSESEPAGAADHSAEPTRAESADSTAPSAVSGDQSGRGAGAAARGRGRSANDEPDRPRAPDPSPKAPPASDLDTARGVVRIVGSFPAIRVTLRRSAGTKALELIGPLTAELRRVGGTEVVATGKPETSGAMTVSSFTVLAVDGQPALDGTVSTDGDKIVIVSSGRRQPLGNPPSALRGLVGARVWVTGPLDTGPNPYGVISPQQ